MAKFTYIEDEAGRRIAFDAQPGEELPLDMVQAYVALKQVWALEQIAENLIGLDNAITAVARAIPD
ncbi:hypothetical protein [Novosphingobium gossypii]|uniref:hypothetical protein n=1 Tax=Novosphingobium gossypii TaxID=1604774 RepID=UPI003D1D58E0